ncbi:hypothetical protein ACP4OV_010953 [Aristida adscensionis]
MPSSFLASPSSSASSPLSYLIPASARPPPPLLMGQGYSANNGGVGGVPASGGGFTDAVMMSAAAVATARAPGPGSGRHAGPGHPPLPRPPPRQCPRCGSANTKFCYYNNYSRTQPRYLCKACRRHWTEGGTLRDVPVGGGRKNRRGGKAAAGGSAKASSSSSPTAAPSSQGGGGGVDTFPDMLRQVLFQPATAGGGGYGIDLTAWQQMTAAAPAPQSAGDVGAVAGTAVAAADANCGALQYWSGWQQDDMPGLDGAC